MPYTEIVKTAIGRVNLNWPLVLIQFCVLVINIIGLIVVVVVPVMIGLGMLGLHSAEVGGFDRLMELLDSPEASLGRYVVLAVAFGIVLIGYMIASLCLWMFTYAGTLEVLAASVRDPMRKFSMSAFFDGARRRFVAFFGYSMLMTVIVLACAAVIATGAVAIAAASDAAGLTDSKAGVFFLVMTVLIVGGIALVALVFMYLLGWQGLAMLALEDLSATGAIKRAWGCLMDDGRAALFLFVLVVALTAINVGVAVIGMAIQAIPLIGAIFSIPYNLAANVLGIYLSLVLLASIMQYHEEKSRPAISLEEAADIIDGGSSPLWCICPRTDDVRDEFPPPPAPPAEG